MNRDELLALGEHPTCDLRTALRAFDIGETRGYELARAGGLPFLVLRVGREYRVPTKPLLETLGHGSPADTTDWRAEAKKWERRAKDHQRVVRSLQAVLGVDVDELPESA